MLEYLARIPGVRRLWKSLPLGSARLRTEYDIWDRPAYAYGIHSAAVLANSLGQRRLTVMEFGVAGGVGLMNMEHIARLVSEQLQIQIDVIGFDTGSGMPAPTDYRDLPHVWQSGFYKMDREKLERRLTTGRLVLGDVRETVTRLLNSEELGPIGFISFDLDYYSSTKSAFQVFAGSHRTRLPRIYCYFDDTIYPERACLNEYVGELCAIREFNEESHTRKIARIHGLTWMRRHPAFWNDQSYVFHDFSHPLYTQSVIPEGDRYRQLPLVG